MKRRYCLRSHLKKEQPSNGSDSQEDNSMVTKTSSSSTSAAAKKKRITSTGVKRSKQSSPSSLPSKKKNKIPTLLLPSSSDDLLIKRNHLMTSVYVYEILRHFRNILKLTPFKFEDFCTSLLIDEHCTLLSEIHTQLLKALIKEDDANGTLYGPQDLKDSIQPQFFLFDALTWPEALKSYLLADLRSKERHLAIDLHDMDYPFVSVENKLKILQHLCDQFLETPPPRDDLVSEGIIKHDGHCRSCYKPGDLLCCAYCPAVYHLECIKPPLDDFPKNEWTCSMCTSNIVIGVTDCIREDEKNGLECRLEPVGCDRNGRKYWFLVRRILVEAEDGSEVWYYSTQAQFKKLLETLDSKKYEAELVKKLNKIKNELFRQMDITMDLTNSNKTLERTYFEYEYEQFNKSNGENGSNVIKEDSISLNNIGLNGNGSIEEEISIDIESILDNEEFRTGTQTRLKTGSIQVKPINLDPLKNRTNNIVIEKDTRDILLLPCNNGERLSRIAKRNVPSTVVFKLGMEGTYRKYRNQFAFNVLSLNKLQYTEERDRKRNLINKFSLSQASEFKWQGIVAGNMASIGSTLRQTIIIFESQLATPFMHPNWEYHRVSWLKALKMCSTAKEFALALCILISSMKSILFKNVWLESLGHTTLEKFTVNDIEEMKMQKRLEKRDMNWITLRFGNGEEFRITRGGGWFWKSRTKVDNSCNKDKVKFKPVRTVKLDDNEREQVASTGTINVSGELSKLDDEGCSKRIYYPNIFTGCWDTNGIIKCPIRKPIRKRGLKIMESLLEQALRSQAIIDYNPINCQAGICSEYCDCKIFRVPSTEKQRRKKYQLNITQNDLQPCHQFISMRGRRKSIYILPHHELRKLARKGGLAEASGFNYGPISSHHSWSYDLNSISPPRPVFKVAWLYNTLKANNIYTVGLQFRILWACIRWDDLKEISPSGATRGPSKISTNKGMVTRELIDKRDFGPFGIMSEYLVNETLENTNSASMSNSRGGLRERSKVTEYWINEEELPLWEIKEYYAKSKSRRPRKRVAVDDDQLVRKSAANSFETPRNEYKLELNYIKSKLSTFSNYYGLT